MEISCITDFDIFPTIFAALPKSPECPYWKGDPAFPAWHLASAKPAGWGKSGRARKLGNLAALLWCVVNFRKRSVSTYPHNGGDSMGIDVSRWAIHSGFDLQLIHTNKFNPIVEDCSGEILNNHDLFLSIGCIHISIIKSKNVQMRQYARIWQR